jgi:hypothetical protein
MQKTDPLREQAQAKADPAGRVTALERLKARSFGRPAPVVNRTPEAQHRPLPKPLVR